MKKLNYTFKYVTKTASLLSGGKSPVTESFIQPLC